jgi:GNAT superfamily N-acetyltransferase
MTGLMETWLQGYCQARGLSAPETVPEGFWLEVAKPQQVGRYILKRFDPGAILALIGKIEEPSVYIEFPGARQQVVPIVPAHWTARDNAYLMERRLSAPAASRPADVAGYVFQVVHESTCFVVEVRSWTGEFVGRGCYSAIGNVAVFDQISIEPEHRRRGLGRCMVAMLAQHAAGAGLSRALLIATEEGRALYEATGWRCLSNIVSVISA